MLTILQLKNKKKLKRKDKTKKKNQENMTYNQKKKHWVENERDDGISRPGHKISYYKYVSYAKERRKNDHDDDRHTRYEKDSNGTSRGEFFKIKNTQDRITSKWNTEEKKI